MKNRLIKVAKESNIDLEIYENKTNRTDINVTNGVLKLFQINNVSSYTIKAIENGKCIRFISDNINDTKNIIDNIKTVFAIQDNDNKNILGHGRVINKLKTREVIDYSKVKSDFLSLEDLKKEFPELINIEITYSHYDKGFYLDNSNSKMIDEAYYNEYGASLTIKGKTTSVLYISYFTKDYDFFKFKNYIIERLKVALVKLDSESCKTSKYKIILQNNAVANILEAFVSSFETKEIILKKSVLQDKYNTKVFSDKISIIEDPSGECALVKRNFDNEGTKTTYKEIIKDGKFIKKINNIEYAIKSSEETTGNSYGVNNLYIKPGNKSYAELLQMLDEGIIIDEVFGIHSGVDESSGNISVQAEGLLVKNGKIVKGLNMIILSTNIFELFSNVLEVGNDLSKNLPDLCAPSLLIENITIAGKK